MSMKNSNDTSWDRTSDERNGTTYILSEMIISFFLNIILLTDVVIFNCNFLLKISYSFSLNADILCIFLTSL